MNKLIVRFVIFLSCASLLFFSKSERIHAPVVMNFFFAFLRRFLLYHSLISVCDCERFFLGYDELPSCECTPFNKHFGFNLFFTIFSVSLGHDLHFICISLERFRDVNTHILSAHIVDCAILSCVITCEYNKKRCEIEDDENVHE